VRDEWDERAGMTEFRNRARAGARRMLHGRRLAAFVLAAGQRPRRTAHGRAASSTGGHVDLALSDELLDSAHRHGLAAGGIARYSRPSPKQPDSDEQTPA